MLPILYQSPEFILYSYPLMMGLGWGVAYQIFFGLLPADYPKKYAQLLYWGLFLSAWIGSKFFFLLTLPRDISSNLMIESSFWVGGGFVFYGGLIFGILFLILFKLLKLPLTQASFWPLIPALTFGHAIGRLGCFLAGCCYGKESDWIWSIHLHGSNRHPTQLIEALGLFGIGFYLLKSIQPKPRLLAIYLLSYGLLRFGVELLRGDLIRGSWGLMTPSQWISLGLILAGLNLLRSKNPIV